MQHSFAVLGLAPTADDALIQLAYQHQLARCRRALPDGPARERRLAVLHNARLLLRDAASEVGEAAIAARTAAGPDRPAAARRKGGPGGWPHAARRFDPYRLLGVHPTADEQLITIAYRHLLGTAAARDDAARLAALECAYAWAGSPAARAAYDLGARAGNGTLAGAGAWPARPPLFRRISRRCAWAARRALAAATWAPPAGARWLRAVGRRAAVPPDSARRLPRRATPDSGVGSNGVAPAPVVAGRVGGDARTPDALPAWPDISPSIARPVKTLRVVQGEALLLQLELQDAVTYTLGSSPRADVRLRSAHHGADFIAAEHARLTVGPGWLAFEHLAAHAVSVVNGTPAVWSLLKAGDRIGIGPYQCVYQVSFGGTERSTLS